MADKDFHWDHPLPAPDFVMIPKLVRRQIMRHLTGAEFKVFFCLADCAYEWGKGIAELSLKELCEEASVGRGTAQDAVKELVRVGLVTVIPHKSEEHGHEANTYRLNVTNDPRYVDRHPMPKIGIAPGENRDSQHAGRDRSRARSFIGKNKVKEGVFTHTQTHYDDRFCAECLSTKCVCGG